MIERIVIAGGGTGGHLFPGIAVVEELRRRLPNIEVVFVGTARGIEARVLPKSGEQLELMDVLPLAGRSPLQLAKSVAHLPVSMAQAVSVLRRVKPQLVIGLGGYAAGPVLLAAASLRIPSALLEQNAHVGITNRMLAKAVGRAYVTYEETAATFGHQRARVVGNPVRRAFVDAARLAEHDPVGAQARSRTILVLGGSQGARALNEIVPDALMRANVSAQGIEVVHQSGAAMADAVSARYAQLGVNARVVPFIDDMARAYANASLVIARAGATTLAEVCAIGRPSILVPFPHAAADHQTKNAEALQQAGAAWMIPESALTPSALGEHVYELLNDVTQRRRMGEAARRLGKPDAAAAIVDDLCAWLGVNAPKASAVPSGPNGASSGSQDVDAETSHEPLNRSRVSELSGVSRRPKVKHCELRLRPIASTMTATG